METVLHLKYFNKLLTNKHCKTRKPRVCGRVVKAFRGSSKNPSSNSHHTRFPQRMATRAFRLSLQGMVYHFSFFFGKSREFLAMILWRGIRYVQSKMICVIIDKVVGDPKGKKKSSFQLSLFRCNYHML